MNSARRDSTMPPPKASKLNKALPVLILAKVISKHFKQSSKITELCSCFFELLQHVHCTFAITATHVQELVEMLFFNVDVIRVLKQIGISKEVHDALIFIGTIVASSQGVNQRIHVLECVPLLCKLLQPG